MSYRAKLNNVTFFNTDIDDDRYKLTSAQVTGSKSFAFTLPLINVFHGQFNKLIDYVEVYKNEKQVFTGRVYSINDTLDKSQKIVCEHISAILYDTIHRPVTYENMTNREVFTSLINNHNSQVENNKKLTIGRVTVTAAACYKAYEKLEKTAKRINDIVKEFGGHLAFRREYTSDGPVNYIDWLKVYDEGCDQPVRFGQNILDIKKDSNSSGIITALIPYGATDDNGNLLDIRSVNNDLDYITAPQNIINKYGLIFDTVTFSDITAAANLLTKAQTYLSNAYTEKITINVTAVDLADAGYDVESFNVGQSIRVISEPHGIDDWFDCTELTLNLLSPASNRMTLGNTVPSYIETQQKQIEEIRDEANHQKTALQKAIIQTTNLITGNKGGYVVFHDSDEDGYPDEILIMDTPSISTARKIWRWNKSGLGYSATGYDGDYGTAMTINGEIVANYITSGVMNAARIKAGILQSENGGSWWNLETGELHIEGGVEYEGSKIYTTQPTPPYSVGDLYVKYFNDSAVAGMAVAGDSKVNVVPRAYMCAHGRTSGQFDETDWQFVFDYYDSYDVESRVSKAEFDIDQQAAEIRSRVSVEDFNGVEIVSEINQSATGVKIKANHLDISGKEINSIPYTEEDYLRISQIIMGTVTPTADDLKRLDFDGDGKITSVDYVIINKLVNDIDPDTRYWSEIKIDPTIIKETIKLEDRVGNKTRISAMAVATPNLMTNKLTLGKSIFRIRKIPVKLTISGDAASQYWASGSVEVDVEDGYEVVGCSGFNIEGQSSSYKPYMMSVYKAAIREENGKYYFDYGITNTGTNTQKITLNYYLMEAHTKEDVNI